MPAGNNFTIEGRGKNQADIQRNFLWQFWIPQLPQLASQLTFDEIIMACKSIAIPGRTIDLYETYFYGQKQLFPITQSFDNKISITLEEREDQKVYKTITNWMQSICSSDPYSPTATLSSFIIKKQYAVDVWLKLYKYNGSEMDSAIRFRNAYPTNLSEVSLDYNSNESVKFSVEFTYDYYQVV